MADCPRLADLERLLVNPAGERDWEALAEHLDSCASCRERIDTLTSIGVLVPDEPLIPRQPSASSAALKRVMKGLQEASPSHRADSRVPQSIDSRARLSCLTPSDDPDSIGRLGNYEIRRVIGQGGMGVVLEAIEPTLKRTVAIKLVSPWAVFDQQTKDRFLREARISAALTHENVVAIYAVDEADGVPFHVLEFVSGESLEDRIQRIGKLPLDDVARLGAQVARGLAAAHAKGLIHRDIKPANVLLTETTDRAKITDFGLAKHAGEHALTMTGSVLGTPEFMSPEQATGKDPDERSDLFSLGAVLYYAATGIAPFHGATVLETLDNVRKCQPKSLQELDANLPPWFCELVYRLLSRDPQKRIGWASAVAEMLEQLGQQRTVVDVWHAKDTVRARPAAAWPLNFLRRWWLIAPVVLAIAAVIAWATLPPGRGKTDVASSQPALQKSLEPPLPKAPQSGFVIVGRESVFSGLADALAAASDGDVIEVHGNGPFLTPPLIVAGKRLTIRAAEGGHPIFLSDTPGGRATQNFLQTDADLRLEGLEIRWAVPFVSGTSDAEMLARCTVRSTYGRLILAHCRIVSPNTCVGAGGRDVLLRGCHLMSNNAVGVFWRSQIGGGLEMDECVVESRMAVAARADRGGPGVQSPRLRMARNTIAAEKCLQLVVEGDSPRQPLPIAADHNIIHCDHLFWMVRQVPPRAKTSPKKNEPADVFRAWVNWSERGNIYRRGIKYVSRPAPFLEVGYLSAEFSGVDAWLDSRKLPAGRSIEGEIHFEERLEPSKLAPLSLESVDNPTGPLPTDTGARREHVGPGPPYHAWRASAEYVEWPKGQGQ